MFACIKTSVVVALTVVAFQGDFSQISEFNLFSFACVFDSFQLRKAASQQAQLNLLILELEAKATKTITKDNTIV